MMLVGQQREELNSRFERRRSNNGRSEEVVVVGFMREQMES